MSRRYSTRRLLLWPLSLYFFGMYLGIPQGVNNLIRVHDGDPFISAISSIFFWLPIIGLTIFVDLTSYLGVYYYNQNNSKKISDFTSAWWRISKSFIISIGSVLLVVVFSSFSLHLIFQTINRIEIMLIHTIWWSTCLLGISFVQPYFRRVLLAVHPLTDDSLLKTREFVSDLGEEFHEIWIEESSRAYIIISYFTPSIRQIFISSKLAHEGTLEEQHALIAQKLYLAKRHRLVYVLIYWSTIIMAYMLGLIEQALSAIRLSGPLFPEAITLVITVVAIKLGIKQVYAADDYAAEQLNEETVHSALVKTAKLNREQCKGGKLLFPVWTIIELMQTIARMEPLLQWRLNRLQE